jgi:hypothetical protein
MDSINVMRGLLVQNWVTIRSAANVPTITQGADSWIDLGDVEDLVLFLDVREVSGGAKMVYQTSPTKQETSFVNMLPAFSIATGVRIDRVFADMAAVPAARFIRWQFSTVAADVTFRLWCATYAWVRTA